jgi:DNA polymerase-1
MEFPDCVIYDGDELLFTVCKACEQEVEFDEEITMHSDFGTVKRLVRDRISDALQQTGCSQIHIAFSDKDSNFRNLVLPSYKQHRKSTGKPVGYWKAKDWLVSTYVTLEYPDLEADDVMGILANDYACVASSDKDLLTVPGRHWSPYKHRKNGSAPVVEVSLEMADWRFLFQTLTGDPVDGFKGCPGLGQVKAARVLQGITGVLGEVPPVYFHGAWRAVEDAYLLAGRTRKHALQQARCARILRPGEWDTRTGPILWEPPATL